MDISLSNTSVAGVASASRPSAPLGQVNAAPERAQAETISPLPEKQDREALELAVTSIEGFVQNIRRNLDFALDDSSGRLVVKVTDGATGEVIRQLPSEEVLRLAESLDEVRSLLFKAEA